MTVCRNSITILKFLSCYVKVELCSLFHTFDILDTVDKHS